MTGLVVVSHALLAIVFVDALLGRGIVLAMLSTAPLPPLVFLPRGRVFEAALADAKDRGEVTPELLRAWRDPAVRAAHAYELVIVTVILVLMFAKPF